MLIGKVVLLPAGLAGGNRKGANGGKGRVAPGALNIEMISM